VQSELKQAIPGMVEIVANKLDFNDNNDFQERYAIGEVKRE
jgi:hypothetical protein